MANSNTFEKKMVAALAKVILDEKKQLEKVSFVALACAGIGGLLLVFGVLQAYKANNGEIWFISIGLVAGMLFGICIYLFSSIGQWPVLKRFLDTEAVLKAHNQEPPKIS